jgi:uncharacterized protein YeaO (DUF488 family)
MIRLKRAYEPPSPSDGYRVLVERLWPRGMRKEALPLDDWDKDLAPSPALRKWFAHDPARWSEFKRRYRAELARAPAVEHLGALRQRAAGGPVTLVFAARDTEHNSAVVLREEATRKRRPRSR